MPRREASGYVEQELIASAARIVSGVSDVFEGYGDASTLRVQLEVTAAVGTLDVVIEDTLDGSNWNQIGVFAQKTALAREVINVTAPFANRIRARWTIGGATPSFTFSMKAASQSPAVA